MAPNRRDLAERTCTDIYRHVFEIVKNADREIDSRLPTERALIFEFQTSRSTVRKALARLEADGIVRRQVGSGTYLGPNAPAKDERLAGELPDSDISPLDVLEARLALQPGLVEFIVSRATVEDFRRMEAALDKAKQTRNQVRFRQAMYSFHLCAAKATRNALLVWLFRGVVDARDRAGWKKMNYINRSNAECRKIIEANTVFLQLLRERNTLEARRHLDRFLRKVITEVASFGSTD
jgi:DNA-binding FadR family transcriptional regulator